MVEAPIQAVQQRVVARAHAGLASHAVSPTRKKVALVIAGLADLIQLGFFPIFGEGALSPPDDVLDVVVAIALFATLGFKARLLAALAIELVPGVALFPSWTAVVATLPVEQPAKPIEPPAPQLPP
jgi:hypothetical protein